MAKEFDKMLDIYRKNTLEYKLSGDTAARLAATNAQKWLDEYIGTLEYMTSKNADYIDKFVKDYSKTNPELVKMQQQIKQVRTEGPVLQDTLETERKAEREEPVDYTGYYIKAGVAGTALAIAAVAGLFA